MRSAWTGLPALAALACTFWDTYPALLAPLDLLALKVILNTIQKVKCQKDFRWSVVRWSQSIGWPQKLVILQGTLRGHLKLVMLKDLLLKPKFQSDLAKISYFCLDSFNCFTLNYRLHSNSVYIQPSTCFLSHPVILSIYYPSMVRALPLTWGPFLYWPWRNLLAMLSCTGVILSCHWRLLELVS